MPTLKSTPRNKKAITTPRKVESATKTTPVSKKPPVKVAIEDDSEDDHNSGSEDDGGVDDEGMEKLMKALGDDGLDEFEHAQLQAIVGEDSGDDGSEDRESEEDEQVDTPLDEDSASEDDEDNDDDELANENEDEEEQDIALDDLDDVDSIDGDAIPRQKVEIDNYAAMARIRETIQLDPSLPWTETLVLSYPEPLEVDVDDDLKRELAFYKQALHGATAARVLASKHKIPFNRPLDYFAEMVKSDSHMERIRQRLLDEGAGIKKSEEKRKERDGKKFGKQVQQEKLKERQQSKKDMEERLKGLKRKRKDMLDKPQGGDDFDIAVEDAISDRPAKRSRGGTAGGNKLPRPARDKKFGFGGAGKRSKQNDRSSTDDFDPSSRKGSFAGGRGGGTKGGRGGARGGGQTRGGRGGGSGRHTSNRLGKSRRTSAGRGK